MVTVGKKMRKDKELKSMTCLTSPEVHDPGTSFAETGRNIYVLFF
jgi:hypothetical protein